MRLWKSLCYRNAVRFWTVRFFILFRQILRSGSHHITSKVWCIAFEALLQHQVQDMPQYWAGLLPHSCYEAVGQSLLLRKQSAGIAVSKGGIPVRSRCASRRRRRTISQNYRLKLTQEGHQSAQEFDV